jgi:hypothetical protein
MHTEHVIRMQGAAAQCLNWLRQDLEGPTMRKCTEVTTPEQRRECDRIKAAWEKVAALIGVCVCGCHCSCWRMSFVCVYVCMFRVFDVCA